MPVLNPTVTTAGQTAAVNAANLALQVKIAKVGFGTGDGSGNGYTPSVGDTTLQNEVARVNIASGNAVSPQQLRLQAIWQDNAAASKINELGFYLEDDTLFALWSDPAYTNAVPFAYKSKDVDFVLAYDLLLTTVPVGSVTILEDNGQSAAIAIIGAHLNDPEAHPQYAKRSKLIGCGNVTGTADAIILTIPALDSFTAFATHQRFSFRAAYTNTGAVTVTITGVGVKDIRKGATYLPLQAGDIVAGFFYEIIYFNNVLNLLSTVVPDASETVQGVVEIATAGEVAAGTDNGRAVSPLGLATELQPMRDDIDDLLAAQNITYTVDNWTDFGTLLSTPPYLALNETVFVVDATGDPAIPDSPVIWAIYKRLTPGANNIGAVGVSVFKIADGATGVTIKSATETQAGIAKLADKTAMDNLINNGKIVTPYWLKYRLDKDAAKEAFHLTWDAPTPTKIFDVETQISPYIFKTKKFITSPNGMTSTNEYDDYFVPTAVHLYPAFATGTHVNQIMYIGLIHDFYTGGAYIVHSTTIKYFDVLFYEVLFDVTVPIADYTSLTVKRVYDYRSNKFQENYTPEIGWLNGTQQSIAFNSAPSMFSAINMQANNKVVAIHALNDINWNDVATGLQEFIYLNQKCRLFILNMKGFSLNALDYDDAGNTYRDINFKAQHDFIQLKVLGNDVGNSRGKISMSNKTLTPSLSYPVSNQSALFYGFNGFIDFENIDIEKTDVGAVAQDLGVRLLYSQNSKITLKDMDFVVDGAGANLGGSKAINNQISPNTSTGAAANNVITQTNVTVNSGWVLEGN